MRGGEDAGQQGQDRQPTRVGVTSPQMRSIEDAVSAVGTLRPVRAVDIVPNVAGRVSDVLVTSGQKVSAGDLLIALDDRAARAALAEAQATLNETEQEYSRYRQLEDSNAAAEARLEEARGAFRRAEAAVMMAEANLEDRTVTAPFAGTLGVIDTEPGSFLNGNQAVTRLADLSAVEVSATLPERYFRQVRPGQTLEITTPSYPNATFEGQVTLRAPEIDLGTRSFEIRAEIDNDDGRLVGGMFARVRLVLDTYEGMTLSEDAIISEGMAVYVYTVADGTAERTEIEIGTTRGTMTEVREGLEIDDRIVVAGWDQLTDGAPVAVEENPAERGDE
nr:efflux RND transporter periplasmic adaptor subunit [Pseudosulfitobacter koreense]